MRVDTAVSSWRTLVEFKSIARFAEGCELFQPRTHCPIILVRIFRRLVECSIVRCRCDGTIKQDPAGLRQTRKNFFAEVMGNRARLIFRDPRTTKLLMQLRQTLLIEKPSPTKNLYCRAPIPEVDKNDPFLIADVFEIKTHEEPPDFAGARTLRVFFSGLKRSISS